MSSPLRYFLLIALFWLTTITLLKSQVVIGSGGSPKLGALLDLKESPDDADNLANSTKGLMLPRVKLLTINDLAPDGAVFTGDEAHTGLIVFNLTVKPREGLCKGIYTWSGETWDFLIAGGCICEYIIEGHDSKDYTIYCDDYQGIQTTATNICQTNLKNYHLMLTDEYIQIWDRPTKNTTEYEFTDGSYFMDHKGWVTLGTIDANKSDIRGVGFEFPGGAPIGGYIDETTTVRCVKN